MFAAKDSSAAKGTFVYRSLEEEMTPSGDRVWSTVPPTNLSDIKATDAVENDEFEFTLQLSAGSTTLTSSFDYVIYRNDGREESERIGDGGSFKLKNGERIGILDINTVFLIRSP